MAGQSHKASGRTPARSNGPFWTGGPPPCFSYGVDARRTFSSSSSAFEQASVELQASDLTDGHLRHDFEQACLESLATRITAFIPREQAVLIGEE